MSDQGTWYKLWCSSLTDEHLDSLDIADFGRWAKLGAYVKKHGTAGSIDIRPPARTLCAMLQVPDFAALVAVVSLLPNVEMIAKVCDAEGVTIATVTYLNWQKYQGDNSAERTRIWRARVTLQKRREEIPPTPQGGTAPVGVRKPPDREPGSYGRL